MTHAGGSWIHNRFGHGGFDGHQSWSCGTSPCWELNPAEAGVLFYRRAGFHLLAKPARLWWDCWLTLDRAIDASALLAGWRKFAGLRWEKWPGPYPLFEVGLLLVGSRPFCDVRPAGARDVGCLPMG